jgi:hypothetical protein
VGALSSNEEIKEIENVVKIFFLEERVIDLASNIGTKKIIEKIYPESIKNNIRDINNKVLQFLTVKGLN